MKKDHCKENTTIKNVKNSKELRQNINIIKKKIKSRFSEIDKNNFR